MPEPMLLALAIIASIALAPVGTVNLIGSGRDKAHEGQSHEGLCPSGHAGDLGPGLKGLGPGGSVLGGGGGIAAESVRPCTGWGASPAAIPTCLSCGSRACGRRLECRSRMRRAPHVLVRSGRGVQVPYATPP